MTTVGIRPLSDEDLAILGLESETVAGHTCKVLVVEEPIAADRLRKEISARLHQAPELSMRLREIDGAKRWAPTEIDLAKHVVVDPTAEPLDEAGLPKAVARVFERRLDRSRPLWRIDIVPTASGGSALVWTLHHALADGMTEMRLGREALWDEGAGSRPGRPRSHHEAQHEMHRRTEELLAIAREAPHLGHHSPFAGQIDNRRTVAFASSDLAALRAAARSCMGTVNDAVLTVVGGGLRRWLEAHHDSLGPVRVKVPVSLHGSPTAHDPDSREPGNRDSFFCLDVPVTPRDPVIRLRAVQRATRVRKREHDAERIEAAMHTLGRISPRLERFAERAMASPRGFALNVSNVPGPPGPVTVAGAPVSAMYSIAEIGQRHALRAAVVSYAGTLRFGLCADPTLVEDVDSLAAEIEADARELASSAGPRQSR
jgi:hypothetical protein